MSKVSYLKIPLGFLLVGIVNVAGISVAADGIDPLSDREREQWQKYIKSEKEKLGPMKEKAEKVKADLEHIRNFENRVKDAQKDLLDVVKDAGGVIKDRLTGSKAEAYANAINTAAEFGKASKAMSDAAADLLDEGEKQKELDSLEAQIQKINENINLSRQYVALHTQQYGKAQSTVKDRVPSIFEQVSAAYDRIYSVAGAREKARRDAQDRGRGGRERGDRPDHSDRPGPRGPSEPQPGPDGPPPERPAPSERPDPPERTPPERGPGIPGPR